MLGKVVNRGGAPDGRTYGLHHEIDGIDELEHVRQEPQQLLMVCPETETFCWKWSGMERQLLP